MKKSLLVACAVVGLSGLAGIAVSQDDAKPDRPDAPPQERRPQDGPPPGERGHRPPPPPLVRALDTDQDGEISAEEIAAAATTLKTLDKDENGKLTDEEIRPKFGGPRDHGPPPHFRGGRDGEDRRGRRRGPPEDRGRDDRGERPRFDRGPGPDGPDDRGGFGRRGPGGPDVRRGPGAPGRGRGFGPPDSDQFVRNAMAFDADEDGKLDKEELKKMCEGMCDKSAGERRERPRRGPEGRGPEGRGGRRGGPPGPPDRDDE